MSEKRKVEDILAELGKKIDQLMKETKKAGSKVSEDMEEQIAKLKIQKEKLEKQIKDGTTNEKWVQAREHMNDAASAINKVRDLLVEEKLPSNSALRMFVQGGGCSGYQYGFAFDEEIAEDDFVTENEGIKVVVDMISSQYLQGATLDYKEEKFNSQFVISNPNAKSTCGCGSSFNA